MMITAYQFHVADTHAIVYAVNGKDTVYHGGTGTNSDEGIHVGCTVSQGLQPFDIKFPVYIGDGQCQQKLGKSKIGCACVAGEKSGQRQPKHMPHGNIHQRNQKGKADDKPMLHFL